MKNIHKYLFLLLAGLTPLLLPSCGFLSFIFEEAERLNNTNTNIVTNTIDNTNTISVPVSGLVFEALFNGSAVAEHNGAETTPVRFQPQGTAAGMRGVTNTAYSYSLISTALYDYTNGHYITYPSVMSNFTNAISVAVWVNPDSPNIRILGNYDNDTYSGFSLSYSSSNTFEVNLGNLIYTNLNSGWRPVSNWYLLTFTYSTADSVLRLYINTDLDNTMVGLSNAQLIYGETEWPDCLNLNIGRHWGGGVNNMKGRIDNVRLYNRVLSAAEISNIYFYDE